MIPQNQRSENWRKWRQDKIGGSDASSIMGCGFKAIGQLWEEKLGLRQPEKENKAMKRGNELEDEARAAFEAETGLVVFPMVCVHPEHLFMVASLDGMTIEKDAAVEIKCPGMKTHMKTIKYGVPDYYFPQLQHQMAVTGLKEIYYFSYCPEIDGSYDMFALRRIIRNDEYIAKLIEREKRFMKILDDGWRTITYYDDQLDTLKDELYKILEENETR